MGVSGLGTARRPWLHALVGAVLAVLAVGAVTHFARARRPFQVDRLLNQPATDPAYATTIQPLFDRRCVVCHACFDAPCQLNLQSFAGVDRGASQTVVYEPERAFAIAPSRMFQDAQTTAEWRTRFDFFPVLERAREPAANLEGSVLYRLVRERRRDTPGGVFDVPAHHACPRTRAEFEAVRRAEPQSGMPFGFPPLSEQETERLADWIRAGAGGPPPVSESANSQSEIAKWEAFLDADDAKTRIFARYVFEHLFFAHIGFDAAPGEWFRLVRSRTAAPAPIDEIATVRPYDDPKVTRVHYRFRYLSETLVLKTHIPYHLDDTKLARLRGLFLDSKWRDEKPEVPSYAPEVASNPFLAFQAIPARSRYQFLLDDAHYHVKTFIHGPVCKGSVALDVIDEQFLIFFRSPDSDPALTQPSFLPKVAEYLAIPAQGQDGIEAFYERFRLREIEYLEAQAKFRRAALVPGRAPSDLWDGGDNPLDAVLTVYRHFDNAFVLRGPVGGIPKTAWVLDYPIFERMYYNLVAGFDVFGNVLHQVATRRYMNLLRIEAEDEFLAFLPAAQRKRVRDEWYRGPGVALLVDIGHPLFADPEPRFSFDDPAQAKDEFIRRRVASYTGHPDSIQWQQDPLAGDDARSRFERAARQIVSRAAPFVRPFPDAALLRVRVPGADDLVYTLVRNRAHKNIDFMFLESEFLEPERDTLHLVRGVAVSRPNFFFTLTLEDVPAFVADLEALRPGDGSYPRFVDRYGVRRNDPTFWAASDFFNDAFLKTEPDVAGIIDLTRYGSD